MYPALTLSGHGPVPAYELMLALGACVLVAVVAGSAARMELPRAPVFAWLSGTYLAAVLGARAAFAAARLPATGEALAALSDPRAIGFSSLGAVAAGGLAAWWLARRLDVPFERLATPLLLGGCLFGAIARVGCFLAGCCHGLPTALPWGVLYPAAAPAVRLYGPGAAVHPWPLYDAALLLAIAARLAWPGARQGPKPASAAGAYLLGRFALEFLRGDVTRHAGLSTPQWLALGLMAFGAAVLAVRGIEERQRNPSRLGDVWLK